MAASVARSRAGVGERLTGDRDVLPGVGPGTERQLEDAERAGAHLAVQRRRRAGGPGALTARAHDKLADPERRVGHAVGRLRREPLVQVLMPIEDEVGPGRVQARPQLAVGGGRPDSARVGREEQRLVPDGELTLLGARREIAREPRHLRRERGARQIVVQHDDVPVAQVVAVIAEPARPHPQPEVVVRRGRALDRVLVVAERGARAVAVPTPGRVVAVRVIGGGAHRVGVVAQGKHRARDGVEQLRRGLGVGVGAGGGITRAHEHLGSPGRFHVRGQGIGRAGAARVRERHAHAVEPGGRVAVAYRDRGRLAGGAPRAGGPVTPGDRIGPRCVAAGIAEQQGELHSLGWMRAHVGPRVQGGREILRSGRGGRRRAGVALRVRHHQRYRIHAVARVLMGAGHAGPRRTVAEVPGVGQRRVALRIERRAAVERDGVLARVRPAGSRHRGRRTVTHGGPRIDQRLTRDRNQLPGVSGGIEPDPQHTVARAAHLAVGRRRTWGDAVDAARSHDDLADAVRRVGGAVGRLGREALVVARVTVEHQVGAGRVQGVPQRQHRRARSPAPRVESRVMPVGHRALGRVGGEIGAEPLLLDAARAHVDVAVEHDHVPRAEVVAVVALGGIARSRAEIAEVAGRARGDIVFVAGGGIGACLVPAPGRAVAVGEVAARAVHVDVVPRGEHGAGDRVEDARGRFIGRLVAARDVARSYQHGLCSADVGTEARCRLSGRGGAEVLAAGGDEHTQRDRHRREEDGALDRHCDLRDGDVLQSPSGNCTSRASATSGLSHYREMRCGPGARRSGARPAAVRLQVRGRTLTTDRLQRGRLTQAKGELVRGRWRSAVWLGAVGAGVLCLGAGISARDDTGAVLVGAGDIVACERGVGGRGAEATAKLLDRIPGAVFTAGDNAYQSGSLAEFTRCYDPTWGRHKRRTHPVPGNHEYETPGAAGYFGYFGAAAGDSGKGYYSYTLGAWHIVALNSNIDMRPGSAQLRWLRADLTAHPTRCALAYWHHPRFSSGTTHGSAKETAPLWRALYEAGVDVVIAGHEHNYERFAPQDPLGVADSARGIREFVVGTGGDSHFPLGPRIANSEVANSATFGVLQLTLEQAGYRWEFIPVQGKAFTDSGGGSCH